MDAKQTARALIDSLPNDASIDDVIHALYIHAKLERGASEIRDGKGIPHDQAAQRLQKWVR